MNKEPNESVFITRPLSGSRLTVMNQDNQIIQYHKAETHFVVEGRAEVKNIITVLMLKSGSS